MTITNLWDKLSPRENSIENIKKDLREGKAPELPFFIVDQNDAKSKISGQLNDIDGSRMQTTMIIGSYGNGKTNLLKYLQLFFSANSNGVSVLYSRADVEQPDIILFLLRLLQERFINEFIEAIQQIRQVGANYAKLTNNFEDNFISIKEYAEKIFDQENTSEDLKKLIFLGTGRLYTKSQFSQFGLQQLQNFNRREVLVFLLNILSEVKRYIIFEIDEIEKIPEKSKLRFNSFLTSYRELIDLSNRINGHLLLTSFTDATGQTQLENANPAFSTRIKPFIVELPHIQNSQDIETLVDYLKALFNIANVDSTKLVTQALKASFQRNRELIRFIIESLLDQEISVEWERLLEINDLTHLFAETNAKLKFEGLLTSIHQKFYDPLEYYLEANYLLHGENKLDKRNNIFVDEIRDKILFFNFTENVDVESLNRKVNGLVEKYQKGIVCFVPESWELSNSAIKVDSPFDADIVDYDPERLYTLLIMFRENFDQQEVISKAITKYVNQNF